MPDNDCTVFTEPFSVLQLFWQLYKTSCTVLTLFRLGYMPCSDSRHPSPIALHVLIGTETSNGPAFLHMLPPPRHYVLLLS